MHRKKKNKMDSLRVAHHIGVSKDVMKTWLNHPLTEGLIKTINEFNQRSDKHNAPNIFLGVQWDESREYDNVIL